MRFRAVKLEELRTRPKAIVLSPKLQLWAQLNNIDLNHHSAKAVRESYEDAKRRGGLTNLRVIDLEIANALRLATRGRAFHA